MRVLQNGVRVGAFAPARRGFTLIEVLVVIGIIAILAAVVVVAVNPARQFAQARNAERVANVNAILNAIGQNMADNQGIFTCGSAAYAFSQTALEIRSGAGGADVASCIVPVYMASMPFDPGAPGAHFASNADYDSGYTALQDQNGRVTVCAPQAEKETALSAAPAPVCVTR